MAGFHWWAWIILAGVLGLAELHVPGSYLVWIALGAAVTGGTDAAFNLDLTAQIGTFALASAISCGGGYFVYRWVSRPHRTDVVLNERNRLLLGARGMVCEPLVNGEGKVRIADGVWLAAGPDLPQGTAIVVTAVHGTRLHVDAYRAQRVEDATETPAA
ncbi:MAG TPA: NfeD family protein [Stellaceae bacterium]|nr:NfeD family protein [Stellaceae bacterium]